MLARLFDKIREIIEAAETPFAKMAIFLLPILAPIVPATFTGLHIYKLLMNVFGTYNPSILTTLAVIVGLVLEMLGYVGAIQFIHSVFRLVRGENTALWLQVILTGFAYVFYLLAMFLINVQLGKYFGTPPIVNSIVGLLSFITVPTGLLAANYLGNKSELELDYVLRQEQREDRLKAKALKAGINVFAPAPQVLQLDTPQVKEQRTKHASDYKTEVIRRLDRTYKSSRRVMGAAELCRDLELNPETERSEIWRQIQAWKSQNGIS